MYAVWNLALALIWVPHSGYSLLQSQNDVKSH